MVGAQGGATHLENSSVVLARIVEAARRDGDVSQQIEGRGHVGMAVVEARLLDRQVSVQAIELKSIPLQRREDPVQPYRQDDRDQNQQRYDSATGHGGQ